MAQLFMEYQHRGIKHRGIMHPIVTIAEGFREGMLGEEDSTNWCYMVAAPLQGYLSLLGFDCEITEGEVDEKEHYWLTMADGLILDPTADQFPTPEGEVMPPIFYGQKPDWYQEVSGVSKINPQLFREE